jgi:hypothetical protein
MQLKWMDKGELIREIGNDLTHFLCVNAVSFMVEQHPSLDHKLLIP